jgi:hypothetical protein
MLRMVPLPRYRGGGKKGAAPRPHERTRARASSTARRGSGEVVHHGAALRLLRRSRKPKTARLDRLPFHFVGWVERSETHRRSHQSDGFRHRSTHPTNKEKQKRKRSADRRVRNGRIQRDAARATLVRVTTHERFGRARLSAFHCGARGSDRTPPLSSSQRASWVRRHQVLPASSPIPVQRALCCPQTGHRAGRALSAGAARERGDKPRPQAPHSPRPSEVNRRRPWLGEISPCLMIEDLCQRKCLNAFHRERRVKHAHLCSFSKHANAPLARRAGARTGSQTAS